MYRESHCYRKESKKHLNILQEIPETFTMYSFKGKQIAQEKYNCTHGKESDNVKVPTE